MASRLRLFVFFVLWSLGQTHAAFGRVEHSLRHGIVSCTACHVNPIGSGIRNLDGKYYGTHGLPSKGFWLRDLAQIDVRNLLFVPEETREQQGGLGLMEWMGSIHVPVEPPDEDAQPSTQTHLVASYNFGGFQQGLRDGYALWTLSQRPSIIHHVAFGRFNAPFGLLTDEHRTYSRIQSKTTYNDFYMGGMLSGELGESVHYDLAVVNGFQESAAEGAGNFSEGLTVGSLVNFRWMPLSWPLMLGTSGSLIDRHSPLLDPWAVSLYFGLSLDRLTEGWLKGSILLEGVRARNWNDSRINPDLGARFMPARSQLPPDVNRRESQGEYLQVNWDVHQRLTLLYKFDLLDLAQDLETTRYARHGFGFRYYPLKYLEILGRQETAWSSVANLPKGSRSVGTTAWLLIHFWM